MRERQKKVLASIPWVSQGFRYLVEIQPERGVEVIKAE